MIGIEAQVAQATRDQAKKIIRRMTLCLENRCYECDLNKNFDGGACYDSVMEDARTLIEDAYLLEQRNGEEKHE